MNGFLGNVSKLLAGNLFAIVLSMLFGPIISRLYQPADYGIYVVFTSLLTTLLPVMALGYQVAIPLPKRELTSRYLIVLSLLALVFMSALVETVMLLGGKALLSVLGLPDVTTATFLILLPLALLFAGWYSVLSFSVIRANHFGALSTSQVIHTATEKCFSIIAGYFSAIPEMLMFGKVIGFAAAVPLLLNRTSPGMLRGVTLKRLGRVAVAYVGFIYSGSADLISCLSRELPTILFGFFYSKTAAGVFGMSRQIVALPLIVLGDSIARAFFQRVAAVDRKGQDIKDVYLLVVTQLLYLVLPCMLTLALLSDEITSILLGKGWGDAGSIVAILTLSFTLTFLYRCVAILFEVYRKQKTRLVLNIMMVVSSVGGFVLGLPGNNLNVSVWGYSLCTSAVYLFGICYLAQLVGIRGRDFAVSFAKPVVLGGLIFLIPLALRLSSQGSTAVLLATMMSNVLFATIYITQNKARLVRLLKGTPWLSRFV